ncbi:uncharacterized protein LOC106009201 [Heterocephalus glaber]|nr:uncharacterized protein LOC106009201 [Heterocephalus glaber]
MAVVTETEVVWAEPLPTGTSAQRAELIALTKALTLGKGQKLNIYTDGRYAFATAHIHGTIYRERGLLTAEGKTIKNREEILVLLAALWLPKKLAIIHCPRHQTPIAQGNNLANQTAQKIALEADLTLTIQLPDKGGTALPETPQYTEADLKWIKQLPMAQCLKRWWRLSDCRVILPEALGEQVLSKMHQATHMGTRKMQDLQKLSVSLPPAKPAN